MKHQRNTTKLKEDGNTSPFATNYEHYDGAATTEQGRNPKSEDEPTNTVKTSLRGKGLSLLSQRGFKELTTSSIIRIKNYYKS